MQRLNPLLLSSMGNQFNGMFLNRNRDNISLADLFYLILKEMPDGIAISFGENKITYTDLNIQSDNLSRAISFQSPTSKIVGISTTRSIEMIIGVLAILKAGKAYLPLDPSYPQDRLQQIVADSGIDCCLSLRCV